nr:unnamed protein product [Digitaria exilis]
MLCVLAVVGRLHEGLRHWPTTARDDLNYPTMAAHVTPGWNFSVGFSRTVTNVGHSAYSIYIVYLGHLPSSDVSESEDGLSAVEFAHQDLLNQVIDDSRNFNGRDDP